MAGLGARVKKNQLLGIVADPFGEREAAVKTPAVGIIVGCTKLPLVNEGEALFHIARLEPTAGRGRGNERAQASAQAFAHRLQR